MLLLGLKALELQELGLCFQGPLPERDQDECNMPLVEASDEMLNAGEQVSALALSPGKLLGKQKSLNQHSSHDAVLQRDACPYDSVDPHPCFGMSCARNLVRKLLLDPADAARINNGSGVRNNMCADMRHKHV